MTPDGVKAAFGHELGHAFDHQSISDEIQHYNIAGREAFAAVGEDASRSLEFAKGLWAGLLHAPLARLLTLF